MEITVKDSLLARAAEEGIDAFLNLVTDAIEQAIGGNLNAETLPLLNASQTTLLAYRILRDEVSEGGFVQLIYNGYGTFIFKNPFARLLKDWGLTDLGRLVSKGNNLYNKYHATIERDLTDEEFHALFEQCPEFDDLDDEFVLNEEMYSQMLGFYVDEHLTDFITITE